METNKRLAQDFLENRLTKEDRDKFFNSLKDKGMLDELSNTFDADVKSGKEFKSDLVPEISSDTVYGRIKTAINNYDSSKVQLIFKIAASILLPLLIANISLWYYFSSSTNSLVWNEIHIPKGETAQFIFQDGSKVNLNSDSKLSYPSNFNGDMREVILDGDGYFEVSKNPENPFIVKVGKLGVKVYGTAFRVNGYSTSSKIITRLDEGKVSILLPNNTEQQLVPGDEASFDCSTADIIVKKSTISGKPSWHSNELVFDDINLVEVVQILERSYNVQFLIKENTIKQYNYYLKFNKATIDDVLDALQLVTPIKVTKEGDIYVITKS